MKKFLYSAFLICITSNVSIYSQQVFDFGYPFKFLFNNYNRINSYYIGNNPAYLFQDKNDELLTIHSKYSSTNGDYKRFIDPGEINDYQIGAYGKKSIGNSQVFKGSFGFQRTEYNDWQWIFTKDYSSGNPFLIGNKTTGNSRFNGIIMNAEYSSKLTERFFVGTSLKYLVDEGLKEITPKPTSNHRKIDFKFGSGYNITDKISAGLVLNVFDNYENINYSEDQENVNREVTIIKFRGFDFPYVFTKKVETRYSYNNGYLGYFTFEYHDNNLISLSAFAGGGFQKTLIKDNANNPTPDGFWKDDILRCGIYAASSLIKNFKMGVAFNISNYNMWTTNQQYKSVAMENQYNFISTTLGVEYLFSDKINIGLEASVEPVKRNDDDYYSHVFSATKLLRAGTRLGVEIRWNRNVTTLLSYGFLNQSVNDANLNYGNQSEYFTNYLIYDLLYYQTNYNEHSFTLNASVNSVSLGIFKIYFNYSTTHTKNFNLGNQIRRKMEAGIQYCVKAY